MTENLKRVCGVLSIMALLVAFAWTPGEAGLGGIQRTASVSAESSAELIEASITDADTPSWSWSLLVPTLFGLMAIW